MANPALKSFDEPAISRDVREFLLAPPRMIIDGKSVDALAGGLIDVFDPATGRVISQVPAGQAEDIDLAVAAARRALDGEWAKLRPADRERMILKLADLVAANEDFLAQLETLNNGQSIGIARALEVGASVEHLRYMAGWATKIEGTTIDVSIPIPPGQKYG